MNILKIVKPQGLQATTYYFSDSDFERKTVQQLTKYASENICYCERFPHFQQQEVERRIFSHGTKYLLRRGEVIEYMTYNNDLWRACIAVKEGRRYVVYVVEFFMWASGSVEVKLITTYLLNQKEYDNKKRRRRTTTTII